MIRGDEVRFEARFSSERSHNSQLFAPLREALGACGGSLCAVVVGTGPASYTGVRIGIAAAQGIALSRQVPVIGLASMLGVEEAAGIAHFICGDARRGTFFVACVKGDSTDPEITTMDAAGLREHHSRHQHEGPWFTFDAKPPLALGHVRGVSPSAARLARHASKFTGEELSRRATQILEPIYLSAPFVTTK